MLSTDFKLTGGTMVKAIFRVQPCGVSHARLAMMRVVFLLTGLLFGIQTWSTIVADYGSFGPLDGVAYSFWGGLCILALIGVRFPLRMLPILLMQFLYKTIWLVVVGYPMLASGPLDDYGQSMMSAMRVGMLLDLLVIPWPLVYRRYLADFFRRSDP